MTIANGLSVLRIGLAPVLLVLASGGAAHAFTACLALALFTDIADGKIARWLAQTSPLGARLDSRGDLVRRRRRQRVRPGRRRVRPLRPADELPHARREGGRVSARRKHAGRVRRRSGVAVSDRDRSVRVRGGGGDRDHARLTVLARERPLAHPCARPAASGAMTAPRWRFAILARLLPGVDAERVWTLRDLSEPLPGEVLLERRIAAA